MVKSVQKRKNRLIRPSVANVDCVVIVVANPPEPDLYLFDKLISTANASEIPCSIVVNKVDLKDKVGSISDKSTIEELNKRILISLGLKEF